MPDFGSLISKSLFQPSQEDQPFDTELFERIMKDNVDGLVLLDGTENKAVIFFHDNYGNVTHYTQKLKMLHKKYPGYDIWTFDYPSFGRSPGTPNASTLVNKSLDFLRALSKKYTSWIWVAEGLGTAVCVNVLDQMSIIGDKIPTKIILINPFISIGSMAVERQKGVNAKMVVKSAGYEMKIMKTISSCIARYKQSMPVIEVYRTKINDEVPIEQTEAVAKSAHVDMKIISGDHRHYSL